MSTEPNTAERGSKEPGQSATITIPGLNEAQIAGAIELLGVATVKKLGTEEAVAAAVDAKLAELAAGLPAEAVAKAIAGHTDPQHVDLVGVYLEDAGIVGKLLREAKGDAPKPTGAGITKINGVAVGTINGNAEPTPYRKAVFPVRRLPITADPFPAIPKRLKAMKRWLIHLNKKPFYVTGKLRSGELDSPADIAKLATYDEALAALKTRPGYGLGFAIVKGDGVVAVDADKVLGTEKEADALALFGNTYIEKSPSGTGLHAIYFGQFNPARKLVKPFECYTEKRFFTMTGDPIEGSAEDVADATPEDIERLAAVFGAGSANEGAPAKADPDPFAHMPEPKLKAPGAMAELLRTLDPDLIRDDWRTAISSIHLHLGEEGREVGREWCMRGKKYLLSLDTPHRPVSKRVADRQFNAVWEAIAKDGSFRMGAGALFNILKRQHEESKGEFGMSTEDIAKWNDSGRVSGGVEAPDYVDTEANELPFAIDWPVGFVGEIARQIHATSLTRIRSFSIAAGLFAVSLMIGNRFYVRRTDTSLNLYMVLSGKTGEGKEAPRKALNRIFAHTPFMSVIWEKAASATGLLRALENRSPHIFAAMTDEYGLMLQGYSGVKANPNNKDLMALILNLFGSARSTFNPSAYANQRDNIQPIEKPYFTLLGTTTPAMLLAAYTPDLIAAGMVNRIIVVSAAGHEEEQTDLDFTVPEPIRARVAEFAASLAFTNDDDEDLGRRMDQVRAPDVGLEFAEGAFDLLNELAKIPDTDGTPEELWGRYREQVIRVAGVLAVGDGRVITKEHVRWAQGFVDWSVRSFARKVTAQSGEGPFARLAAKALAAIANPKQFADDKKYGKFCKNGLIPTGKLSTLFQVPRSDKQKVIEYLLDTEQIKQGEKDGTTVFWCPKQP